MTDELPSSKPKRKRMKRDTITLDESLPASTVYENWWEDPRCKAFCELIARVVVREAAKNTRETIDAVGVDWNLSPEQLREAREVAEAEFRAEILAKRAALATPSTQPPLEPLQGPELTPVAEPAPAEQHVGRTRRQMTKKPIEGS